MDGERQIAAADVSALSFSSAFALASSIMVCAAWTLASEVGVTQKDVASDLLVSLSSSHQTSPNFWLNPKNGVNYIVYVETPQYEMDSLNALRNRALRLRDALEDCVRKRTVS